MSFLQISADIIKIPKNNQRKITFIFNLLSET